MMIKKLFFQHTDKPINNETFDYVSKYKSILLSKLVQVFDKFDIDYFLAGGNLLEYERKEVIVQDDDIDISLNKIDEKKWFDYCKSLKKHNMYDIYIDYEHNIVLDQRTHDFAQQKINGIQVKLYMPSKMPSKASSKIDSQIKELYNHPGKKVFTGGLTDYELHADVVLSNVDSNVWKDTSRIFTKPTQIVSFMGTRVRVPASSMIEVYLTQHYGDNYLLPKYIYYKYPNNPTYYFSLNNHIIENFDNRKTNINCNSGSSSLCLIIIICLCVMSRTL